jgi:hypothetical protein
MSMPDGESSILIQLGDEAVAKDSLYLVVLESTGYRRQMESLEIVDEAPDHPEHADSEIGTTNARELKEDHMEIRTAAIPSEAG